MNLLPAPRGRVVRAAVYQHWIDAETRLESDEITLFAAWYGADSGNLSCAMGRPRSPRRFAGRRRSTSAGTVRGRLQQYRPGFQSRAAGRERAELLGGLSRRQPRSLRDATARRSGR